MTDEMDNQTPPPEAYASEPALHSGQRFQAKKHRSKPGNHRGPRKVTGPRGGRANGQHHGQHRLPAGVPLVHEEEEQIEPNGETFALSELHAKSVDELLDFAANQGIETSNNRLRKIDLLFLVAKALAQRGAVIHGEGCLEVGRDHHGFLRFPENSYCADLGDIFVHSSMVRKHGLLTGDVVCGPLRAPGNKDRFFGLRVVEKLNGSAIDDIKRRKVFENLTPLFPDERFLLERDMRAEENTTGRIIDIFAPIGKGQRGLLVSPPKTGKTVMLQHIAHAIEENHPDAELIVLLIDERPEEVTEMKRSVKGEVVASTFDEPATRHVQVADIIIEKAKRRVEMGKDVVIMLDSITRLARAYNTIAPQTGRVLTGGVDSQALQRPKRFFGAARNIENGGSLTIIATALVETGSKMDEVIYEEFKGTGNMEIHLDRRIAERRVYPSISLKKCGTRREELLQAADVLQKTWLLRRACTDADEVKNTEWMIEQIHATKNNASLFAKMER